MDVADKSILITGASSGIGLATAQLLAVHGARVALAARNEVALAEAVAELRAAGSEAVAITCDVTKDEDVHQMIDDVTREFGGIDVAINNAGRAIRSQVETLDIAAWQSIIDLNLYGPLRVIQAVVPVMRSGGGGIIMNVSSGTVQNVGPSVGGYASTKAALDRLSRSARAELADANIRVLVIWPARTATDFGRNALQLGADDQLAPLSRPSGGVIDSAQDVAERILWQIETEEPETAMNQPIPVSNSNAPTGQAVI
jgi:NAD(P)-dependent dehydrogenase (short-subunit alcohol dehydrogenase family)